MKTVDEWFSDSIFADKDSVWIISTGKNLLQQIDRATGKVVDTVLIPTDRKPSMGNKAFIPYRSFFKNGNNLYFLPYFEKTMRVYDLKNKVFSSIKMRDGFVGDDGDCLIIGYSIIGTKVLMYSYSSRECVCLYDILTGDMDILDLSWDRKKSGYEASFGWIWNHSFVMDDVICLIPQNHLCLVLIDVKKKSVEIKKLKTDLPIHGTVDTPCLTSENLFFIYRYPGDQKSELLKLHLKTGNIKRLFDFESMNYTSRAGGYTGTYDNLLVFLPGMTDKSFVVDLNTDKIEMLPEIPVVSTDNLVGGQFPRELNYRTGFMTEDGHLLTVHGWTGCLVDLDLKTMESIRRDIVVECSIDRVKLYLEAADNCIKEDGLYSLDIYLDYIFCGQEKTK